MAIRGHALIAAFLLIPALALAAETGQTAQELMQAATAQAAAGNKNILVVFHASWCGWCQKFEAMLTDKQIGPIIDKYFVVVRLDVQERGAKAALNTPGGDQIMVKAGVDKAGLPLLAMFDRKGELIVNSMRPGGDNIGYPAKPEEIAWFMEMLNRSAPQIDLQEIKTVKSWLKNHAH